MSFNSEVGSNARWRMALLSGAAAFAIAATPATTHAQEASEAEEADRNLDTVTVVGSRIAGRSAENSPSPLQIVDDETFQLTGTQDLYALTTLLTVNAGSQYSVDTGGNVDLAGTGQINLRNLGLGSTLVLVNGRRQTVSSGESGRGETFVDVKSIVPQIAVERIDILKDGAAALYGTEAVAGVVDFRTRSGFEGAEFQIDYGMTTRDDDWEETSISGIIGDSTDRASFVVAGSYRYNSLLQANQRDFSIAAPRGLSQFGNPGTFIPLPVGVAPVTPLAPGIFAAVPFADPDCPDGNVISLGGPATACTYQFGANSSLVPEEERVNIWAEADFELLPGLELYAETSYTASDTGIAFTGAFPIVPTNAPILPADHPAVAALNLSTPVPLQFLGRTIGDNGLPPGNNSNINNFADDTYRFVGGLKGSIPGTDTWTFDASYQYSRNERQTNFPDTSTSNLFLALDGFGGIGCDASNPANRGNADAGCFFWNPFGNSINADPSSPFFNSPEVLDFILTKDTQDREADLMTIDFTTTGELFQVPAGVVQVALGAQYREETRAVQRNSDAENFNLAFFKGGNSSEGARDVIAFFGEAAVPVFDGDNGSLDLQLALRYEEYDNADTTDPKIALLYRTADGNLSLRGSWGTSFRAPSLADIATEASLPTGVFDPINPSAIPIFVAQQPTPNPDLEPEESETFNIGGTWEPIEGLSFNLDYYNISYENLLTAESVVGLLLAEAAAACLAPLVDGNCTAGIDPTLLNTAQVERAIDPVTGLRTSTPTIIRPNRINAASLETDGVDFSVNYSRDVGPGTLGLSLDGTYVLSYDVQETAGGPTIDGLGNRNVENIGRTQPELKMNAGASYLSGGHAANFVVRYIDSYTDTNPNTFVEEIDSYTSVDGQYSYTFDSLFEGSAGTTFTLGVVNLFDEDPPEADADIGFDVTSGADSRGRVVYLRLKQAF
jgi:outer membrane receptor protein involved in Fe transport